MTVLELAVPVVADDPRVEEIRGTTTAETASTPTRPIPTSSGVRLICGAGVVVIVDMVVPLEQVRDRGSVVL